ncbi:hypothetical protein COV53_07230 [Candidatus Gottesmanbacteria bacterium CG11_big_fil_rev_8_21_14_0_20_37_11]|uniref:Type II secretion system protein GspF domain-containing protein n=2 Tax=Candidatus Gottesmaniibacteriota TaxID=1752720 RepID=A0A2M7RR81_9BACT|nr:MAG: hypothetical protein COV53_07230 [Candidatus Gottesmanbacteria bacterium CG11_big_fil_rev_8_21_14_0_20_37_11]PIZ02806.1 MAG: hypothetical protein COY59_02780 [Candidatus Gottesmanbacteria bacterium CG_4_10_14_0_8_um_filter_37_24]
MISYKYIVKDQQGKTIKGLVEANSIKQATNLLHERGYYIISMKENASGKISIGFQKNAVSFNDVVHFTRQLSTMVTAGLTLVESLSIIQEQIRKAALLKLVKEIHDEIQGGKSFADALEKYPRVFPPVYMALVKAGEASGKLDQILTRLADNLEKSRDFKNKLKGALVYPMIVLSAMVIVSIVVMTVVVPKLTSLYKEFDVELPITTKILIGTSNFLINYWWALIVIVIVTFIIYKRFKATDFGRHVIDNLAISLPVFGNVAKEGTIVEITRTLAILIDGGVPILTSLEIAKEATSNILYIEAFNDAAKKVEKGVRLSEPLSDSKLFPPILAQMIAVGEQTGKLGDSLFKLSRFFESESENAIRSLTTMIEPLIMVVLGLGVGFMVMSIMLPIYSLTSKF